MLPQGKLPLEAKGMMHCTMQKRSEKAPLYAPHAPEYGAKATYFIEEITGDRPWYSTLLFEWFSPLIGLANSRHIAETDLFSLCDAHRSREIAPQLDAVWSPMRRAKGKAASLPLALLRVVGLRFLAIGALKLTHDAMAITVLPLLVLAIVAYEQDAAASAGTGLCYLLVVVVSGVSQSLLRRHTEYFAAELGLFVQSSVSTVTFKHILLVSPSTLQRTPAEEVVGYITRDGAQLQRGVVALFDLLGSFLQASLGGLLLWHFVGHALWAGLATLAAGIPCTLLGERLARQYGVPLIEAKDERLQLSQEMVAGIKTLKLLTWEQRFTERVLELRDEEMRQLMKRLFATGCKAATDVIVPVATVVATLLAHYTYRVEGPMDVSTVFATVVLLGLLLLGPLLSLPRCTVELLDFYRSLSRINSFLTEPERVLAKDEHPKDGVSVVVKNADFKWDTAVEKSELDLLLEAQGILQKPTRGPALHHIIFYAEPGQTYAVVGESESGKSTLLAGIVGLVRCCAGEVAVHGTVAYVNQEPFLLNATIRENICFGQPYDTERYAHALRASCLKYDWPTLPRGDSTVIGGGDGAASVTQSQRVRVALARSVYQNANIYIFDDVLTGMDGLVARKIFKKCIQTALKGKVVIVATRSLRLAKRCSNVVVLGRGTIIESGDFKTLLANRKRGILSELIRTSAGKDGKAEHKAGDGAESSDEAPEDSDGDEAAAQISLAAFAPVVNENGDSSQQVDVESGDEHVPTAVVLWFIRSLGEKGFFVFGLLILLHVSTAIFELSSLWQFTRTDAPAHVLEGFIAYSLLFVLSAVASSVALHRGCVYVSQSVHQSLVERLSRAPMAFFDATPTQRVLSRASRDLTTVDTGLVSASPRLLRASVQLVVTVGLVMVASPWLVLALAPLILTFYRLQKSVGRPVREMERLEAATLPPIQACMTDVLAGVTTIRLHKAEHLFLTMFHDRLDANHQATMFKVCADCWLGIRVDAIYVAFLCCAALAAIHVHDIPQAAAIHEAGEIGVAFVFAVRVSPVLFEFVRACDGMWSMLISGGKIKAYSKLPTEASLDSLPQLRPPQDWPTAGAIDFDNVSVRYREGLPRIIRGVSFAVPGGSSVAIIGPSGSGRKSLFAALTRLVELTTGSITIDGVDISKMGLHDLRSRLALLCPDPVFFSGSIRSNLDATQQYTDDEIWNAVRNVDLHGAVLSLDEVMHERGANYSVGERQLLGLARAMLRKPKIVLVDEGESVSPTTTSAAESAHVDHCWQLEFAGATKLTITQRVGVATAAAYVLVMVNGQAAEFGTPKDLQKNGKGVFRAMLDDWKRRDKKKS